MTNRKEVHLRIAEDRHALLAAEADRLGMPLNAYVSLILSHHADTLVEATK